MHRQSQVLHEKIPDETALEEQALKATGQGLVPAEEEAALSRVLVETMRQLSFEAARWEEETAKEEDSIHIEAISEEEEEEEERQKPREVETAPWGTRTKSSSLPLVFGSYAEALLSVLEHPGADLGKLVQLCNFTRDEIKPIEMAYKFKCNRSLSSDIKDRLSGSLRHLLLGVLYTRLELDCYFLVVACVGYAGIDAELATEILIDASNSERTKILLGFNQLAGRSFESFVTTKTGGSIADLLLALCRNDRDESQRPDHPKAAADARALYKAGKGKLFTTDRKTFISAFTSYSWVHLADVAAEYQIHRTLGKNKHRTLDQALESEFIGDFRMCMRMILHRATSGRLEFYVNCISKAIGGSIEDNRLSHCCLVWREPDDMKQLKFKFKEKLGRTLAEWVSGNISGVYCDCLLALIGVSY